MIRLCASGLRSLRQYELACRTVLKVPFMCTRTTASHSSSVMLKTIRSRRMPATFTSTSSRPKVSMAWRIRPSAASKSATSPLLATAWPPFFVMSSTTCAAGELSCPLPSTDTPRSATTTLAPSLANSRATLAPIPRPAPVTIAVRPSSLLPIGETPLSCTGQALSNGVCGLQPDPLGEVLAVVGAVAQEQLAGLGPLEEQVRVMLPGEPDPAVHLDHLGGHVEVRLRRVGLEQRRQGRDFVGVVGHGRGGVGDRRPQRLDLHQPVRHPVLPRRA